MLDIKLIRQNPDKLKKCLEKRGIDISVDNIIKLDNEKRKLLQESEGLRAKQKKLGKDDAEEAKKIKDKIKELEVKLQETEETLSVSTACLPNLLQDDVPEGKDDSCNIVVRTVGKKKDFKFKAKNYLEIAEKLDLIDIERAAKVAGSRFGYLKKEAALLEFALVNFTFDLLVKKGFVPIITPVMLKSELARGTGYFEATDKEEAYYLPKDDLFLIGTSEQSIAAMHSNEIFAEKDLPRRYAGFSTCFRREAGAYGKDTKGILRVHQFDKVEMFSFCHPDKSEEEHKFLLSLEEKLMQLLEIPYRVIQMCAGDIALPQAAKYDIEAWLPGQNQYRETHSTSTCTDFQARRLNTRFKNKNGKLEFVHTLNGTALAIGRTLIAIIENYQQKDGSVKVPKALQRYTHFKTISQ